MAQVANFVKVTLLSNFANYSDRKIFYYRSLKEYKDNAAFCNYLYKTFNQINFNPADGIETTLVLNSYNLLTAERFELDKCNE